MHDQLIVHVYGKRTLITINCWLCVTVSRYEGFFLRCVLSIYYVNTGPGAAWHNAIAMPHYSPTMPSGPLPTTQHSRTVAQNVNNIHNKFVLSYHLCKKVDLDPLHACAAPFQCQHKINCLSIFCSFPSPTRPCLRWPQYFLSPSWS